MSTCIFCNIVKGSIPSQKVYEDKDFLAFKDINPAAPTHILVIPKKHIARVEETTESDVFMLGRLVFIAKKLASELGLEDGYRLVFNNGKDGGQEVEHIHLHLLGGRSLTWPPG
ncbi:MAG: histidine triad nucleotide-binding protein [Spirochaetales bacterium]|nr:histidine triad nucleotide-binding protein [Spirochaetales bacterium]